MTTARGGPGPGCGFGPRSAPGGRTGAASGRNAEIQGFSNVLRIRLERVHKHLPAIEHSRVVLCTAAVHRLII